MRSLTLSSLKLGLHDLLDKRHPDLVRSRAGVYYESSLRDVRDGIDALPAVFTGGTPLSAELEEVDARHDGHGGALFFYTESVSRMPDATPDILAAARRVRAAFIPELAELKATYAKEAERAIERRPQLTEREADLKLFPTPGGKTLLDTATAFLAAGEQLHHLLSERADVPKNKRTEASRLRPQAIGILGRLRDDLEAEVARDASLPRDLVHRVFGYIDTLLAMQATPAAPPAPPAPAPGG